MLHSNGRVQYCKLHYHALPMPAKTNFIEYISKYCICIPCFTYSNACLDNRRETHKWINVDNRFIFSAARFALCVSLACVWLLNTLFVEVEWSATCRWDMLSWLPLDWRPLGNVPSVFTRVSVSPIDCAHRIIGIICVPRFTSHA